ncbi:hypothetical protein [uncultured Helicobacter sp.]|uniref:hypothetical protein n=2 Tax=uncultured Helicobacter sp. TaxID=175537 RepID=UPI00262D9B67|nr:hypothetical protein [uncultured Helicobacter sp.]
MSDKKFVIAYISIISILVLIVTGILHYLSRIFEHNSFEAIIQRQIINNSLYGTALNENVFAYKLELIKQSKPKVIALGSSRVLQLREEFFNTSFISAGNAMNTLNEGQYFLEKMLKFHQPELILLGLDIWWFHPHFPNNAKAPYHSITGTNINYAKLIDIIKLIYKQNFFQFSYIIDNHFIRNPYTRLDSLGLNAMHKSRGFLKDGSYIYGEIFESYPTQDARFQDTLERINQGTRKFEYASAIDDSRLTSLLNIMNTLHKHNIKVIIFFPPVAPSIYAAMKEKEMEYQYVNELFFTLQRLKINFFNYHNSAILHNDNCEFIDGFHGGDIFYARILRNMAEKSQTLMPYVNILYLNEIIDSHAGKVFSKDNISYFYEQDFLSLGCKK